MPDEILEAAIETLDDLRDLYTVPGQAFDYQPRRTEADVQRELSDCTRADRRVDRFVAYTMTARRRRLERRHPLFEDLHAEFARLPGFGTGRC